MKVLIVEDDFMSRKVMMFCLTSLGGSCEVAVDGQEAVSAVTLALEEKAPYDVIFLDIMMPNMDGHDALKSIRRIEDENGYPIGRGAKIVMTTALSDHKSIMSAFREECDGYLIKPVKKEAIKDKLFELGLIS